MKQVMKQIPLLKSNLLFCLFSQKQKRKRCEQNWVFWNSSVFSEVKITCSLMPKDFSSLCDFQFLKLPLSFGSVAANPPHAICTCCFCFIWSIKFDSPFGYTQAHPGTEVILIDLLNYRSSIEPMWKQVDKFGKVIQSIMQRSPEGVHLLCFSQGHSTRLLLLTRLCSEL